MGDYDDLFTDIVNNLPDPSFSAVDLGPVLAGTTEQPTPSVLRRHDGTALLYAGMVNGIHGDSGIGKGWVALYAVHQQLRGGRHVVVVDTEDTAPSIVARLRLLGTYDDELLERLHYVRPVEVFSAVNVGRLVQEVADHDASLVVVDSLGECFGLDAIDENHDAEVAPWLRRVARRLADAGPAVLLVDHATKAADNPLHPSGSKRKRAAIGGASYLVTATAPLTVDRGGRLAITCAKDRHGTYRTGDVIAHLTIEPALLGGLEVELWASEPMTVTARSLMVEAAEEACRIVRDHAGSITQNVLLGMLETRARQAVKRAAIELAVLNGALTVDPGPRGALLYGFAHDYDETPT